MISQAAVLTELVFRGVRKIEKSDYWHRHICLSVRPCVRMEHLGCHWTDFHKIWYLSIFRKFLEKLQVSLRSGNNNAYFTWRLYICDNVPLNSSYKEKMFQTEVVQKIKTRILSPNTFLKNLCGLWDHVEYYGRGRQATDDNTAYLDCMLDT